MVTGSVAVVTGASSGIGRSIAVKFAQLGYSVVAHGYRNRDGIAKTLSQVADSYEATKMAKVQAAPQEYSKEFYKPESLEIFADVSDPSDCERLVRDSFRWKGHVDVWVNCAGADVLTGENSKQSFDEKLEVLWRTDVAGTIRVSRLVASQMVLQVARTSLPCIVNISWDQSEYGMEGDSGQYFAATKAAVAAFSKSLAKSVAPRVRVNCIAPGWIKTDWGNQASPEWDSRARGESMLNRWGAPEDIANVAAALASAAMEFVNGQTIAVNGGWQPPNRKANPS
ncbi:MAG: SDR family oxidoreductase [Planctomycetota bacterium]|nr:SDR family oxidoreductase [Planctomycetota bacterium]